MTETVNVVDLGVNNLRSLTSALEELALQVIIHESGSSLQGDSPILLPGTGSFSTAVASLEERNFREPLIDLARTGVGILGICLGAQLLLDKSEEGSGQGLGLIVGESQKLPSSRNEPVPLLGWRRVSFSEKLAELKSDWFYFAHSYEMRPASSLEVSGTYLRSGSLVTASLANSKNIFGFQFHPEKSGPAGLKVLDKTLRMMRG